MKAYAIKSPINQGEYIFASSIRIEEEDCKNDFDIFEPWETFEEAGYRCVPVEITEIKQEKVC